LKDAFPPQPSPATPLFGYHLERTASYRGPGDIFVIGPSYTKRSLSVDESRLRRWFNENSRILASARPRTINSQYPYVLVVLREWVAETWAHISWGHTSVDSSATMIGLFQESGWSAPQWNYLRISGQSLSITKMDGSLKVNSISHVFL
jgi:hypothetical protein